MITPLMTAVFPDVAIPDGDHQALILTSETAVIATERLRARGVVLPKIAFCVGDRTAKAATEAGFDARSADGDADDLIALVVSHLPHGSVLHLRGRDTRGAVADRLRDAGLTVAEAVVYAQEATALTDEAKACLALPGPVAVPMFSPRSAALFRAAIAEMKPAATLIFFAMSPAVARELADLPAQQIFVATEPTQDAMAHKMSQALFGA